MQSHVAYLIKSKLSRKSQPLDYYYANEPLAALPGIGYASNNINRVNAGGQAADGDQDGGDVIVNIPPMGNGRVRETTESIREEDAEARNSHVNRS